LGVAAGTKLLAERIDLPLADEAFLAGLIHDIGLMVLMQVRRPKLVQVLEKVESESISFREAELQVIGATHEQFGKALCEKWKFPASLARVAGHHHEPARLDPEARALACLVHAADVLSGEAGIGYGGTVTNEKIDEQVLAELKLPGDALDEIRNELPEAARVADTLMS
jgi:HD-like signal output (HDOD) protein